MVCNKTIVAVVIFARANFALFKTRSDFTVFVVTVATWQQKTNEIRAWHSFNKRNVTDFPHHTGTHFEEQFLSRLTSDIASEQSNPATNILNSPTKFTKSPTKISNSQKTKCITNSIPAPIANFETGAQELSESF